MGKIPAHNISPALLMNDGKTRPGQSHSIKASDTLRVWKCLVLPGVEDTATRATPWLDLETPRMVLMALLLPTNNDNNMKERSYKMNNDIRMDRFEIEKDIYIGRDTT